MAKRSRRKVALVVFGSPASGYRSRWGIWIFRNVVGIRFMGHVGPGHQDQGRLSLVRKCLVFLFESFNFAESQKTLSLLELSLTATLEEWPPFAAKSFFQVFCAPNWSIAYIPIDIFGWFLANRIELFKGPAFFGNAIPSLSRDLYWHTSKSDYFRR